MVNPKNICIAACVGFVLSFIIGLVSGVSFGIIILRALIFALVFGAMAFGISFLYKTFLSETSKSNISVDSETAVVQTQNPAGNVVNIVVDDSTLADEDSAPKFAVGANKNLMGASELAKTESPKPSQEKPADGAAAVQPSHEVQQTASTAEAKPAEQPASANAQASFVPAGLNTLTQTAQGTGSTSQEAEENPSADEAPAQAPAAQASSGESLDDLPDIGSLELNDGPGGSASVVSDSDFARNGSSSSGGSSSGQDTNVMAQAIRTLLARDD